MNQKRSNTWYLIDLGLMDYRKAWTLQTDLVATRHSGGINRDIILMVEHPAVFTLGRRGGREHLLISENRLEHAGIPIVQVERGGKITYHGPGQLVVYPILNLAQSGLSVVDYVNALEEVMIRTCAAWGVPAERNEVNRGIWVGRKKIGSIGIAVRRDISFHGMALNVAPDLDPFCWVEPCGLEGVSMTSIEQELDKPVALNQVKATVIDDFSAVFGVAIQSMAAADLPLQPKDSTMKLSLDQTDLPE